MIYVFITNRDLLTAPRALANRVAEMGGTPIIVDNDSVYEPTLDWYAVTRFTVEKTGGNHGQRAAWDCGIVAKYMAPGDSGDCYVVTDGDLNIDACPDDTLEHLRKLLLENPDREKVGLSLRIDDIPEHNKDRAFVLSNEEKFWQKRLNQYGFDADIETTFAMYRRGDAWRGCQAMRTDKPYTAVHVPWYWDSERLPDDAMCYLRRAERQWTGYTARMGDVK